MGPDDRADDAGDDLVAGEGALEEIEQLVDVVAWPCSTASESMGWLATLSARSLSDFERVRTFPASSTTPSRISTTGLIDSIEPRSARAFPTRPPFFRYSSVSSAP